MSGKRDKKIRQLLRRHEKEIDSKVLAAWAAYLWNVKPRLLPKFFWRLLVRALIKVDIKKHGN